MIIRLTSPYQRDRGKSKRIAVLQAALKVPVDSVYGPITSGAAARRSWKLGLPVVPGTRRCPTSLTLSDWELLTGRRQATPEERQRAQARRPAPAPLTPGAAALKVMLRWEHLTENPPNSNRVPELCKLANEKRVIPWIANMAYPWCGFATWLASLASERPSRAAREVLLSYRWNGLYCPEILRRAERGEGLRIVPVKEVRAGDIVLYDWERNGICDHVGRVIDVDHVIGTVHAIEGNTSAQSDRNGSQSDGGGVYKRIRPLSLVRAFVREVE